MGLKYLQLFADMMDDHFQPLTDEELGIIIRAAMDYAFNGTVPTYTPRSVLDLTWRRMKRHIDQCAGKIDTLRENGSKGGNEKANRSKAKQNVANDSKVKQTVANDGIKHDHEHEHDHEQEEIYAREETGPDDDGLVLGIDGNDLSEHIAQNQLADSLILRYRLSSDDITREALIHDLGEFGEDRMREVLTEAAQSNSRERVSVKFWRAILQGKGRDSPKDSGVGYGQVLRQRDYSQDYWKSIEVNLDE